MNLVLAMSIVKEEVENDLENSFADSSDSNLGGSYYQKVIGATHSHNS